MKMMKIHIFIFILPPCRQECCMCVKVLSVVFFLVASLNALPDFARSLWRVAKGNMSNGAHTARPHAHQVLNHSMQLQQQKVTFFLNTTSQPPQESKAPILAHSSSALFIDWNYIYGRANHPVAPGWKALPGNLFRH